MMNMLALLHTYGLESWTTCRSGPDDQASCCRLYRKQM